MLKTNLKGAALATLLGVTLAGCGGSPGGASPEGGVDSDTRRWSAAQPIDLPTTANVTEHALDISPAGRAAALWRITGDGVYAAVRDAQGVWQVPVRLGGFADADDSSGIDIAVADSGEALAVWVNQGASPGVRATRHVPGGGWQAVSALSDMGPLVSDPEVEVDANGTAVVIWRHQLGNGTHALLTREQRRGQAWSGMTELTADLPGAVSRTVFDMLPSGQGAVTWTHQLENSSYGVSAMLRQSNGSWGTREVISPRVGDPPNAQLRDARLAWLDGQTPMVAWLADDGPRRHLRHSRLGQSGWSPAATLPSAPEPSTVIFDLAADGDGHAMVVAVLGDVANNGSWRAVGRPHTNGAFGPATALPLPGIASAQSADVRFDRPGRATAALTLRDRQVDLWTARWQAGRGWYAPQSVESVDAVVFRPRLAGSATGESLLHWVQDDGQAPYAERVQSATLR